MAHDCQISHRMKAAQETMFRARVADIVTLASRMTRIHESHLYGSNRAKRYVHVRNAIIWVARRQRPQYSYPEIGRILGGRDHSTVLHAHGQAEYYRNSDADFRRMTDELLELAATAPAFIKDCEAKDRAKLREDMAALRIQNKPEPVAPPQPPRAVKAKNDFRPDDGDGDNGHKFAFGTAAGSQALVAAINAARAA